MCSFLQLNIWENWIVSACTKIATNLKNSSSRNQLHEMFAFEGKAESSGKARAAAQSVSLNTSDSLKDTFLADHCLFQQLTNLNLDLVQLPKVSVEIHARQPARKWSCS